MTATLNKVQLIGNLGAEPKLYTTKEGSIFVTATLATDEAVKRNGEWETIVEWHQLIFFGSMTKVTEHLHGELGVALLCDYSIDDASTLLSDCYYGAHKSKVDFARFIFEEYYGDSIPNNLAYYFDHEAFSNDLFRHDYFSIEAQGRMHVFSNC